MKHKLTITINSENTELICRALEGIKGMIQQGHISATTSYQGIDYEFLLTDTVEVDETADLDEVLEDE